MDEAVKAGLPKKTVKDKKGRVLIDCCYKCGKVRLAKEERSNDD
jgi:hypothetical protein